MMISHQQSYNIWRANWIFLLQRADAVDNVLEGVDVYSPRVMRVLGRAVVSQVGTVQNETLFFE